MTRFPTPGHLVSWAKLSPRTVQSGAKNRAGKTGKGNPYLKAILGEAAAAVARIGASRSWLSADGLRSRTPPPPPTGRPDWARPARPCGSRLGRSGDHRGGVGEFRATPPFPA